MPLYWRNKTLLAKVETTYGTDSAPTAAANAILASDVRLTPMEGQDVSRELESRGYMGGQPTIAAGLHAKLTFKVEIKGSGTAGTAPAFGALLRACAMAEVIVASTSVTYNPITAAHESCTIHVNVDGTRWALTGARGTATYRMTAQGIVYLEFEMTGLFVQPSAVALTSPTLGAQLTQVPQIATSANTPTFTVGGTALILRSFALAFGNTVSPRFLVRSESIIIEDRQESIEATVEAVALATYNPFALAAASTSQAISLVHGTGAGKITTLSVPAAQVQRPSGLEQQQGIVEWPLRFVPLPVSGNDQFTLAFT